MADAFRQASDFSVDVAWQRATFTGSHIQSEAQFPIKLIRSRRDKLVHHMVKAAGVLDEPGGSQPFDQKINHGREFVRSSQLDFREWPHCGFAVFPHNELRECSRREVSRIRISSGPPFTHH